MVTSTAMVLIFLSIRLSLCQNTYHDPKPSVQSSSAIISPTSDIWTTVSYSQRICLAKITAETELSVAKINNAEDEASIAKIIAENKASVAKIVAEFTAEKDTYIAKSIAEREVSVAKIKAGSDLLSAAILSFGIMYFGAKIEHGMTMKETDFERFLKTLNPKTFLLPFTGVVVGTTVVAQLTTSAIAAVVKLATRFFGC